MSAETATHSPITRHSLLFRNLRRDLVRYLILPTALLLIVFAVVVILIGGIIEARELTFFAGWSLMYVFAIQSTSFVCFGLPWPPIITTAIAVGYIFLGFLTGMTFGYLEVIVDGISIPEYAIPEAFLKGFYFGAFIAFFRTLFALVGAEYHEQSRSREVFSERY